LTPRICFLHIPKCGGTTIHRALRQHYSADEQIKMSGRETVAAARETGTPLMDYRREQLPSMLSTEGCRYVAGHIPFCRATHQNFRADWRFITILREPVSRWLSQYFYNRYKTAGRLRTKLDLSTYVARARRSKAYSGMLADVSRFQFWKDPANAAIETLEKLDVVGCLERLDDFKRDVEALLGAELDVGHERRNPLPAEEQQRMVTPEIRRRVEELCAGDKKIYAHALGMVDRRRARGSVS